MPQQASQSSNVPPLPPGYKLDEDEMPPLPAGYKLDTAPSYPRLTAIGQGIADWARALASTPEQVLKTIQPQTALEQGLVSSSPLNAILVGGYHTAKEAVPQLIESGKAFGRELTDTSMDPRARLASATLAAAEKAPFIGSMIQTAESGGPEMFNPQAIRAGTQGAMWAVTPKLVEEAVGIPKTVKAGYETATKEVVPSLTKEGTRPVIQSQLFDRALNVRQNLANVAKSFYDTVSQKWQHLEQVIDTARPEGAIDTTALRDAAYKAVEETVKVPQKLPPTAAELHAQGEIAGASAVLDELGVGQEFIRPTMSWAEARQLRSKLGREVYGNRTLSGEARAAGKRIYNQLTDQMRAGANEHGLASEFDVANKLHQQYIQDFVDRRSPLTKAIAGQNPHQVMDPLSNARYAEQARRALARYKGFGADPTAISQEGLLFQKYKSGLPYQIPFSRYELAGDVAAAVGAGHYGGTGAIIPAGLSVTGTRIGYNWAKRLGALRELHGAQLNAPPSPPPTFSLPPTLEGGPPSTPPLITPPRPMSPETTAEVQRVLEQNKPLLERRSAERLAEDRAKIAQRMEQRGAKKAEIEKGTVGTAGQKVKPIALRRPPASREEYTRILLAAKEGEISPGEADRRIARLGGRVKVLRRPQEPSYA